MKKKTKRKFFRFRPYECTAVEEFLENMAEEGWLLESISGYFFKFKKIEPKKIKYSVDSLNKISIFDSDNAEVALEYREYCEGAGWKYICRTGKNQVFFSEDYENVMPIHTDPEEKFKTVFKSSIYEILGLILIAFLWSFNMYMQVSGSGIGYLLSSNLDILSQICILFILITTIIDIGSFFIWIVKSRRELKANKFLKYNTYKQLKRKNRIINIFGALIIFSMVIASTLAGSKVAIAIPIIIGAIFVLSTLVERLIKKKGLYKSTNMAIYIGGCVIVTYLIMWGVASVVFSDFNLDNKSTEASEKIITLKDFGYKGEEVEEYSNYRSSIIAAKLYSSVHLKADEAVSLDYEYFQSDNPWVVNLYVKGLLRQNEKYSEKNEFRDIRFNLIYQDSDIYKGIKVYFNEVGREYLLVSENKAVKIKNDFYNISNEEFLNIIYKKVFAKG